MRLSPTAARSLTLLALGLGVLVACRRESGQPMAPGVLFPDATAASAQAPTNTTGALARVEVVPEAEPNDQPADAQPIAAQAFVDGMLRGTTADPPAPPDPDAKPSKKKGKVKEVLVDQDWYRLPAPPVGQSLTIDLRSGPECATLELFDDTGKTAIRQAKWWKSTRPVLPSIGPDARATLVRVSCRSKTGVGGAYRLAVWTRPVATGDEVEPNDDPNLPTLQVLTPGTPVQGTLAPAKDADAFTLDLRSALPGEALVLSVTGVPDVELELEVVDPVTHKAILTRRPAKGAGALVPNLDVGRTGDHPIVVVRARSGQAPDTPYVLTAGPFLPPGCARQADCLEQLPNEREPNDRSDLAMTLPGPGVVSGLIDAPGDVDWYAAAGAPGAVLLVRLEGPAQLTMALQVGEGANASVVRAEKPGEPVALALGGQTSPAPIVVCVRAEKDGFAPTEVYRLTLQWVALPDFEVEPSGRDAWAPAQLLVRQPVDPESFPQGGWQRHGALLPAGDRDAFGVDLSTRQGPVGLELACLGDGAPGLMCAVEDSTGASLVRIAAPSEAGSTSRTPLVVNPGRYRVVVTADPPRASPMPYAVGLRESPDAVGLPAGATTAGTETPAP